MINFDNFTATQDNVRHATADKDRHLIQLLKTMQDKIHQLEMKVFEMVEPSKSFDERVLEVLDVRSFSARAALQLEDTDVQRWMMSAIEENSGEAFSHIEAEIDEKLCDFTDSYSFTEAVAEAVQESIGEQVKQKLDDILHDAIIDAIGDPEDIVRKGLRSIL